MNTHARTYCALPHIGLGIQNYGEIAVCNQHRRSLKQHDGTVIQVHKHPLKDAWSSPVRQEIIQALDNGIEHELCKFCFDQERSGVSSQRQQINQVFGHVKESPTQPRVLIIKPGNVCNLQCRMCNPDTSSGWYADGYKLDVKYKGVTESFAQWTKRFEHIRDGFHEDNSMFWQDLTDWLPGLDFFDIYGGEPFLSQSLFRSLKTAADSGASKNVSLQLHTNVTIYNEEYLDTLAHYKSVTLGLSIDSHDPAQLNYIRYPADAEQVLGNIVKFEKFFAEHKNHVNMYVALCVNILNIFNIGEIYTALQKFDLPIGMNIVWNPSDYDIRALPAEVKQIILDKNKDVNFFEESGWRDFILQEIPNSDQQFRKFWQVTQDLDVFRNQQFQTVFPEYYSVLEPYVKNL